ncbi:acylneuraminate cytidylyltransferase family protein [bacterium]|nr:acylneuraminate cytidylyltransferase family protein [bacterium]
MKNESVLCIICARGGSKGIPNKNIRSLIGKPLLVYTIEQALAAEIFDHIVMSTDSDQIAEVAKKHGAEVFFKRPVQMATDEVSKLPARRHALLESEKHFNQTFSVVIDLDATSPLRIPADIVNAYQQFLEQGNDNLITAMPARRSPYFNLIELAKNGKVVLSKELEIPVERRQDSPPCYDMNASIYIWKRNVLLNEDSLFLDKTGLYVMPEERSIDIDSELDFQFVEWIMQSRR